MQVTCPACKKTSNISDAVAGKIVTCACGKTLVTPAATPAANLAAATVVPLRAVAASDSISVKCECGRGHRVPATAAGKAVKCACGKIIKVPAGPVLGSSEAAKPVAALNTRRQAQPVQAVAPANPFHALSDADWANLAPKPPPEPDPFAPPKKESATTTILNQARADLGQTKKAVRSGAGGHLASSRWILIGIGVLKLALCIFQFVVAGATVKALGEGAAELNVDDLLFAIQAIAGVGIGISVVMILMGIFVFLMPMTCAISALVLFILLELVSFVFNPFLLINIRAWIIRAAMFGALIQAINNAAFYKFVKTGGRD